MPSFSTNTLILVRHGQDQDNANGIINGHRNTGLTTLGKEQAKQAGKKLKNIRIDAFYSSPLRRAQETAQIIENIIKKPSFQINPLLIERDFGILTGKRETEINKYAKHFLTANDGSIHFWGVRGEESPPQLFKRGEKFLAFVEKNYTQKTILLITHLEIGKMIDAAWSGESNWQKAFIKIPYLHNGQVTKLSA